MVAEYIMGSVLGFLSGLGTGGGSLLILWLTLGMHMPQREARVINLMFFIPSALIASFFRRKQGSLNLPKIVPAIAAGCISAAVFSLLSTQADLYWIRKLFGGLLIFTGLREVLYRRRNPK